MSGSESDVEMRSNLKNKIVRKQPSSPIYALLNNNLKKITTKVMICDALVVLHTRKGVSLYAIKKYLTEKYEVNAERIIFLIKKAIKRGVEDGSFIQVKGIGASGSFKLAPPKKKTEQKKPKEKPKKKLEKKKPEKKENESEPKKVKKVKSKEEKPSKTMDEVKKMEKKVKQVKEPLTAKTKAVKIKENVKTKENVKLKENDKVKGKTHEKKGKIAKEGKKISKTPSKKKFQGRKSIGSIIKPPKMKPRAV